MYRVQFIRKLTCTGYSVLFIKKTDMYSLQFIGKWHNLLEN